MIELAPPDLTPGDLGGQDSWTTVGTSSIQMATFDSAGNFEGSTDVGVLAECSHGLPDFSTASNLTMVLQVQYAADQGVTEDMVLQVRNSGSTDANMILQIRYSIASEALKFFLGNVNGTTEWDSAIGPGSWVDVRVELTAGGTNLELFVDGVSRIVTVDGSAPPFSDADEFLLYTGLQTTGVNEWHGRSLTLTAT